MIYECFNCGDSTEATLTGTATYNNKDGLFCIPLCDPCASSCFDDGMEIEGLEEEIVRQLNEECSVIV
jgi:hypothetical protein